MFLVLRGELEGRLDVLYYLPEIMELERIVRSRSNGRLGKFIQKMSSGATPTVQEEEKYYSDKENGIPFIRVQNLSPTNELQLDDLKYINRETHENYLKRSQVKEHDLLVKITGVGRMAVASVAPPSFHGNTNQHLVVIKTENKKTSETLATFLNSDIGEKLASRRSTGGTRPALDYNALRSIPIVYLPESVEIINKAISIKRAKEEEATRLLTSLDGYLLDALGIVLPETTVQKKTFFVGSGQVSGGRLDPIYYTAVKDLIKQFRFELKKIKQVVNNMSSGYGAGKQDQADDSETGIVQIRPTNIEAGGQLKFNKNIYVPLHMVPRGMILKKGDVLFNNTNSQELVGKTAYFDIDNSDFLCTFSNHITRIRVRDEIILPQFLQAIFNLYQKTKIFYVICTNWNNQSGVGGDLLMNLEIPLPPIDTQAEIVAHITATFAQARQLEVEAQADIEAAKREVESMILGKGGSEL